MSLGRQPTTSSDISDSNTLENAETREKKDLGKQNDSDLRLQESHANHQYEGFPDYHLDNTATSTSSSLYLSRTRVTDPRSIATRILTRRSRAGKEFTHPLADDETSQDVRVEFDGPDDEYHPMNWTFRKKAMITMCYAFMTVGATWGSSIYSSAVPLIAHHFHVGKVVSTLGVSLYLFGFGTGPMLWAPLSEVYGRRPAVFTPYFVGICFCFGSATAKDFQTLMLCRFFTGFFSSAPVTNTGGVLGDLWTPVQRGGAMAVYAMATAGGPLLAPVVGGAIVDSYLGWRWTEYTTGMLMSAILLINILVVDETYTPVLLVYKARRLRHETNNWSLHARHEEWDVSISSLAHKYLVRPFQILFTPIAALMTAYASFCYGILYLSFASFPIIFQEGRHWNSLVGSLPFLGIFVGCLIGSGINISNTKYYAKRLAANNGRPVPEARLPPMMLGSILFSAGIFIVGWTATPSVFWFCPVVGAALIGAGFVPILQGCLNYLIDTFQLYAASAVACTTAARSSMAGVFPLFGPAMFHGMGTDWACTLIGCIATAMIPIPFLFFFYGEQVRRRGKWSRPSTE